MLLLKSKTNILEKESQNFFQKENYVKIELDLSYNRIERDEINSYSIKAISKAMSF